MGSMLQAIELTPALPPLPPEFVLFDLEYTAWEGSQERQWSGDNEHREVIQIGAIRVSGVDWTETDHLLVHVKPAINPQLSAFIVELTGITQDDIEARGVSFAEGLRALETFIGDSPTYCWGKDFEVLQENCHLASIPEPGVIAHMSNLRPILSPAFEYVGIDIRASSSGTLIEEFSKKSKRRAHDALNDMRNLRDAVQELRARLG